MEKINISLELTLEGKNFELDASISSTNFHEILNAMDSALKFGETYIFAYVEMSVYKEAPCHEATLSQWFGSELHGVDLASYNVVVSGSTSTLGKIKLHELSNYWRIIYWISNYNENI